MQRSTLSYMIWPLISMVAGLGLAAGIGYGYESTMAGAMSFLVIAAILAVLEISLSFDNAIVNAQKLRQMTPEWQKRFLTWGILIAVFGMRLVFPLIIVVVAANLGPWQAIVLAATQPDEYSRLIHEAHLPIAAFGGSFLMLVALNYFFAQDKEVDWIAPLERPMRRLGEIRGIEVGFVLLAILVILQFLPAQHEHTFVIAAIWGVMTYLLVDGLGKLMDNWGGRPTHGDLARGGFGAFMYLEILDASFSFDGVVGAFALTQNLFLIAIGLGIGAMFVRAMTVLMVDRGTLSEFRFLEHGAFYSILVLSMLMFLQILQPVPEVVTGLLGAGFIATAFVSSLIWRRNNPDETDADAASAPDL